MRQFGYSREAHGLIKDRLGPNCEDDQSLSLLEDSTSCYCRYKLNSVSLLYTYAYNISHDGG